MFPTSDARTSVLMNMGARTTVLCRVMVLLTSPPFQANTHNSGHLSGIHSFLPFRHSFESIYSRLLQNSLQLLRIALSVSEPERSLYTLPVRAKFEGQLFHNEENTLAKHIKTFSESS